MSRPIRKASSPAITRKGIVVLLGALAAIGPFSIDTYLPAFGRIASEFGTDVGKVGLSLSSYFAGICLGQLVYGPLMDRFGRRAPLLWGLALFAIASLLCAQAVGIPSLVALRFLQALGGCAGMVAGRALVRDLFPDEAADIFSSMMLVMGVAPVIAPSVGTWITETLGWRSIFGFLFAVSLTLLGFIAWKLPVVHTADEKEPLHLRTIASDYIGVMRQRSFQRYGMWGSLVSGGLFAYIAGSPGTYMGVFGLSRTLYGWTFAINAVALIAGSQINRWWLRRATPETIVRSTLLVQSITAILLAFAASLGLSFGVFALVWVFLLCQGFLNPNITALAMRPFRHHAGIASALVGALQMGFGAILSGIVSIMPEGTATPMATGMLISSIGGALLMTIPVREG